MPGSLSVRSQASRIRAIIGALSALRACGRFIVTISTCPRRSMRACGCPAPEPVSCAAVAVTAIPHSRHPEGLPQNSNTF